MTTQGAFTSGIEGDNDDQGAPPQAPQVPVDPLTDQVTNEKLRFSFQMFTQVGIETTKFYGLKLEEDP